MVEKPAICAHRGGAALKAENSLEAFEHAAVIGADQIELDVHLSSDGVPVVMHDPTLDRTTEASGPVSTLTATELSRIRILTSRGCVPRLDDVLEMAARSSLGVRIELKSGPGDALYPGLAESVHNVISTTMTMLKRCTIIGFDIETLRRMRDVASEIHISQCYARRFLGDNRSDRDVMQSLKDDGINGIEVWEHELSPAMMEKARAFGLKVGVWTPNGPASLTYWLQQPVDHITTDQPDLALRLRV